MAVGGRKQILVLGGGFAGMFAAKELRRHVGRVADIELINEVNYFTFQPLLPEVAAGGISVRDAVAPLRRLLPGVRVRQAQIYAIDLERKIVTIFQGLQRRYTEVGYDHLVLALGQTVDLSRIPGLAAHALTMKTLSDALTLRNAVIDKLEHADITALPEVKKELLTFTVIGGGFSGVETAGEMMELIERSLVFYPNIQPERGPRPRRRVCRPAARRVAGLPRRVHPQLLREARHRGLARDWHPRGDRHRDRHHDRRGHRHPDLGRDHRQRTVAARRQARRCRTSAGGSGPTAPCASRAATTSGRSATPR